MELTDVPGSMKPRSEMNIARTFTLEFVHKISGILPRLRLPAVSKKEATTSARAQVQYSTVRVLSLSLERSQQTGTYRNFHLGRSST